jgi:AcrR family transcriptional regulator
VETTKTARSGGRGARERILEAADQLFYLRGIHATGVAALVKEAHVSTRTFYQHFATKNALIEAYLRRREGDAPTESELQLDRDDLSPAERLLAIFLPLNARKGEVLRGCPFHNAAVESAGDLPGVSELVDHHKRAFVDRLVSTARQAGAADPESLGRQLAVIYEGAHALAASCNDSRAFTDAQHAAAVVIKVALESARERPGRAQKRVRDG